MQSVNFSLSQHSLQGSFCISFLSMNANAFIYHKYATTTQHWVEIWFSEVFFFLSCCMVGGACGVEINYIYSFLLQGGTCDIEVYYVL